MKRKTKIELLSLLLLLFTGPLAWAQTLNAPLVNNPEYKTGWNMVFQDEFNGNTIDPVWHVRNGSWGTHLENPFFYVLNHPDNVEVSGGTLKLRNQVNEAVRSHADGNNYTFRYTAGMLSLDLESSGIYFGPEKYYEIRCRLPYGDLHHPGYWTWTCDPNWSEVDFYENGFCGDSYQRLIGTNSHYFPCGDQEDANLNAAHDIALDPSLPRITDAFYTVGVHWTTDHIDYYVNNHFAKRVTINVPQDPGELWLGNALTFSFDPDDLSTYPTYYNNTVTRLLDMEGLGQFDDPHNALEVDYVRVYEKACEVTDAVSYYGVGHGYVNQQQMPRVVADINGDMRSDVVAFGSRDTRVSLGQVDGTFAPPMFVFADYSNRQGYQTQSLQPRLIGDVDGDGYNDIVAFGYQYTTVRPGNATGTFDNKVYAIENYTIQQGYSNQEQRPRMLADVNGDGRMDIVAFAWNYTLVSLGQVDRTFGSPIYSFADFTMEQGYVSQSTTPRMAGDVNGDGFADIVAFGPSNTYVALGTGTGHFNLPMAVSADFTIGQGYNSQEDRPRLLADVNGDGRDDLVAFGYLYTTINLGQPTGYFGPKTYIYEQFTNEQGWHTLDAFPRRLADVNGDCKADIIGFGEGEMKVAISTSSATTAAMDEYQNVIDDFTTNDGWTQQNTYPRMIADVTGDGFNDLVAFGYGQVYTLNCLNTSLNTCTGAAIYNTRNAPEEGDVPALVEDVLIYPNPSGGTFTIEGIAVEQYNRMDIYNALGALVYTTNDLNEVQHISLKEKGIYMISLIGVNSIKTEKLVIK